MAGSDEAVTRPRGGDATWEEELSWHAQPSAPSGAPTRPNGITSYTEADLLEDEDAWLGCEAVEPPTLPPPADSEDVALDDLEEQEEASAQDLDVGELLDEADLLDDDGERLDDADRIEDDDALDDSEGVAGAGTRCAAEGDAEVTAEHVIAWLSPTSASDTADDLEADPYAKGYTLDDEGPEDDAWDAWSDDDFGEPLSDEDARDRLGDTDVMRRAPHVTNAAAEEEELADLEGPTRRMRGPILPPAAHALPAPRPLPKRSSVVPPPPETIATREPAAPAYAVSLPLPPPTPVPKRRRAPLAELEVVHQVAVAPLPLPTPVPPRRRATPPPPPRRKRRAASEPPAAPRAASEPPGIVIVRPDPRPPAYLHYEAMEVAREPSSDPPPMIRAPSPRHDQREPAKTLELVEPPPPARLRDLSTPPRWDDEPSYRDNSGRRLGDDGLWDGDQLRRAMQEVPWPATDSDSARPSLLSSITRLASIVPVATTPRRRASDRYRWLAAAFIASLTAIVTWQMIPRAGSLRIELADADTHPRVDVFVDGTRRCETTPCVVEDLELGTHAVQLVAPDGATLIQSHEITGRGSHVMHLMLAPAEPARGRRAKPEPVSRQGVELRSELSRVTVAIDGKRRGTLPILVDDLSPGMHRLRFTAPGRRPVEREVEVRRGAIEHLHDLTLPLAEGRLTVRLVSPGARLLVGRKGSIAGRQALYGPWPRVLELDMSEDWEIVAGGPGYVPRVVPIVFDANGEAEVTVQLQVESWMLDG
ncbi:MAG: hypothetical protein KC731_15765 [Myxococcales bacterium]|nr:hypothetical protein [Myxococcales bacterium]